LVRAKYRALKWLEDKDTVATRAQIKELQHDLLQLAEDTSVVALPTFEPIPEDRLLEDLRGVGDSLGQLQPGDAVLYISPEGELHVNPEFRLNIEQIRELLTKEIVTGESESHADGQEAGLSRRIKMGAPIPGTNDRS
jgi:hypothetical protein